ncbi:MAG: hypothetical protein AB9834_01040 [Lentimicrobium sp.]
MKKKSLLLPALFMFTMMACTQKQKEAYQSETQLQNQEQPIKTVIDDSSLIAPLVSSEKAVPEQTSTAVVMNPPHGQPGHLCEIPVGSPLPATPGKTKSETGKIKTTPPVETAKRLNPPHGQPGHRCEIVVGAPLDTPAPTSTPAASSGSFTPTIENAAKLKSGQR